MGLLLTACNLSNGFCADYVTILMSDTPASIAPPTSDIPPASVTPSAPDASSESNEPITENKLSIKNEDKSTEKQKNKTFLETLPLDRNESDYSIRKRIFSAHRLSMTDNTVKESEKIFESLLLSHPTSPRVQYGIASTYDKLADLQKSNQYLEKAIDMYYKLSVSSTPPDTPTQLLIVTLERLADRAAFRGFRSKAIDAYKKLVQIEIDNPSWRNKLGILYLTYGNENEVRNTYICIVYS